MNAEPTDDLRSFLAAAFRLAAVSAACHAARMTSATTGSRWSSRRMRGGPQRLRMEARPAATRAGGHTGPESNHYQKLRASLEAQPAPADPAVEAFRQTGIARFAQLEREAAEREREERITGRIH
jgi:hypothetical protein